MAVRGITAAPSPARFAALVVTALLLLVAAWEASIVLPAAFTNPVVGPGMDVGIYLERTTSWMAGDGFYRDRQLGGPYTIADGDALYPPPSVLLFAPFVLGAPMVLWWAIPLGLVAAAIWKVRPPWWAWPLLALILVYPRTWTILVLGNPSMWALAGIAAGAAWGGLAVLALLKPVFAPFVLVGLRDRRAFLVGLAVVGVVSLAFLPMWPDYARVLLDASNPRGIEYTLGEVPIGLLLTAGLYNGQRIRRGGSAPKLIEKGTTRGGRAR